MLVGLVPAALAQSAVAQAGVRLSDLPALARARNERLRPKMETALAPYVNDLAMDYGVASNRAYIDRRIAEVALLGDSLVPLLLEKLRPDDPSPEALNTAANTARILALLGPASFVTPLMQMVSGDNSVARSHAIPLLAKSGHVEAGRFLEHVLGTLPRSSVAPAVHALRTLERGSAATKVADLVSAPELQIRAAALEFLTKFGSDQHKPKVIAALRSEAQESLLPSYLDFLQQHAAGDAEAATALLGMLEPGKLFLPRQYEVVRALATIAPKGHDATLTRLRALIAGGELQHLGRACATTMAALGDNGGRKELFEGLDKEVKKNPKVPSVLANRAEASFAFEKWNDAMRDFKDALRSARSLTMQREFYLWLARCHVRLKEHRRAAQVLKEGFLSKPEIEAAAHDDPVFKQALSEQADLKALLKDLGK